MFALFEWLLTYRMILLYSTYMHTGVQETAILGCVVLLKSCYVCVCACACAGGSGKQGEER